MVIHDRLRRRGLVRATLAMFPAATFATRAPCTRPSRRNIAHEPIAASSCTVSVSMRMRRGVPIGSIDRWRRQWHTGTLWILIVLFINRPFRRSSAAQAPGKCQRARRVLRKPMAQPLTHGFLCRIIGPTHAVGLQQ